MKFLLLLTTALFAMSLWTCLAGVSDMQDRTDRIDDVTRRSDPVSVAALKIFQSLSEADSALAEAFLTNGATSTELDERYRTGLEQRYRAAITRTVEALHTATAVGASTEYTRPAAPGVPTGNPDVTVCGAQTKDSHVTAVAALSNCLHAYTGLVETARTYIRQGLPEGSAYLRTASELVRSTMHPIAWQLYEDETRYKTAEQDRAGERPWSVLAWGMLTIGLLIGVQVYLSLRTKRSWNLGLLLATLATGVGIFLLDRASAESRKDIGISQREGTEQVSAFAELRTAALQARAAEALTLVFRGNGAELEKEFGELRGTIENSLAEARATVHQPETRRALDSAHTTLTSWWDVHDKVRMLDIEGEYSKAVRTATGPEPGSAASLAGDFDRYLDQAFVEADSNFDGAVQGARDDLNGVVVTAAFFFLGVSVPLVLTGMWARIVEYILPTNTPHHGRLTVATAVFTVVAFTAVVFVGGCGAGTSGGHPDERSPATTSSLSVPKPMPAGVRDPAVVEPQSQCVDRASYRPRPLPPEEQPTLQRIRDRGILRVGARQTGYLLGYHNTLTGEMDGFEVALAREIAREIFDDPTKIQFVEVDLLDLKETVDSRVDILFAALGMTCDRWRTKASFSTEYLTGGQQVLVNRYSDYKTKDDLRGKKVCAAEGSINIAVIHRMGWDPVSARDSADCLFLLQQGLVDGVSTGKVILSGLAAQDGNTRIVGPRITDAPIGAAISHNATDLVRFVNGVLERIRSSGEWDRLYAKWLLPSLGPASAPTPRYRD